MGTKGASINYRRGGTKNLGKNERVFSDPPYKEKVEFCDPPHLGGVLKFSDPPTDLLVPPSHS